MADSKFHFPQNIQLKQNPLIEAWLDIRWKLHKNSDDPKLLEDSGYQFAYVKFHSNTREDYPFVKTLPASKIPEGMTPYLVRHQFRKAEDEWPLLQLGPGVATLNYLTSYSWDNFRQDALKLRKLLLEAYEGYDLELSTLSLSFRSGLPFEFSTNSLQEFFSENMNMQFDISKYVPGAISDKKAITSANLLFTFDIDNPVSQGKIRLGTAIGEYPSGLNIKSEKSSNEMILLEISIQSKDGNIPDLKDEVGFEQWLNSVHAINHEWFIAFIDGAILESFKTEGQ